MFSRPPAHFCKSHWFFFHTSDKNKTFSRKNVVEKETLTLNKCPDKMPKRTKLLPQQTFQVHQPRSLVSEGFTVKAMMKNSVVRGPPVAGAFKERPAKPTTFRKCYERGDFPIALEHDSKGNKIAWKVSPGHSCDSQLLLVGVTPQCQTNLAVK